MLLVRCIVGDTWAMVSMTVAMDTARQQAVAVRG